MNRSAVRVVLRRRGARFDVGDASYRVYIAIMLVIIVVAPIVRAGLLWLRAELPATSGVAAGGEGSPSAVAPVLTVATALLCLAGSRIGPARAGLPQLDLLHVTPVSRARLLGPSVARWLGVGALVGLLAAAVAVAARALRGEFEVGLAVALPLALASIGLLAAAAPLVGQLGPRARALAALLLGALAAAQWWTARALDGAGLADPWSIAARLLSDASTQPLLAVVPVAAAVAMIAWTPAIAARLRWEALREQALRWDTVQTLVVAGDPSAGLARLGAPVRWGRRIRFRPGRGLTGAIAARDLLGVVRAPGRSLLALGGASAAGALWAAALGAFDPSSIPEASAEGRFLLPYVGSALLGAASLLLAYLSSSAWCRGMAAAAQGSGSPPLLPVSPASLIARHLVVPAVLTAVALGAGALLGAAAGGLIGPHVRSAPLALLSAVLVAGVVVAMRAAAALKGTIPLRLLAPVPTPAGDMAGVNVLMWTLDGPIAVLFLGAALGVVWALACAASLAPLGAALVTCAVLACGLLWARIRLGRSVH